MPRGHSLAFSAILCACIGCDHATKQLAQAALAGSDGFSLAADILRFQLVANPGAFLSVGAALPAALRHALLIGGVPVLLAALCLMRLRGGGTQPREVLALALICGGGLGNWSDRLLHQGAVTDFVSLGLGPLRTGIFNLADVAVVIGVGLLLMSARIAPPLPERPT